MDPTAGLWLGRTAAVVALGVSASVADLKTQRIPNALTGLGLLLGVGMSVFEGWAGLSASLLGAGLGLGLGVLLFATGGFGGGDGKLLGAFGAWLGIGRMPGALLVMALLGGLLAAGFAVRRGIILPALLSTARSLRRLLAFGQRRGEGTTEVERPLLESSPLGRVPYGVAIAGGAVIWWLWGGRLA